jgi:polysaccharide biosynthesis/export protein
LFLSRSKLGLASALLAAVLRCSIVCGAPGDVPVAPAPVPSADVVAAANPLSPLGAGDSVTLRVFGQPDMDGVLVVADDDTIRVPLIGAVQVKGLSAQDAAKRIEKLFKDNGYFVNPHVTLTMTQSLSQRVSVLGEVRVPGRYAVDSKTSIVDLLAQAGGETEVASDTIYILRTDSNGQVTRYPVNLRGLTNAGSSAPTQRLLGGDSVFVPKAEQFYILGEVQKPGMYKIEDKLTVTEAISLAGGITLKGSTRRVEVKHAGKNGGDPVTAKAGPNDLVQPNDVIRVKESIF